MSPAPSRSVQALFSTALEQHRAGRLADAERAYRRVLEIDPRHADAWHFLGVLAHQSRRFELAAEWIGRAITLEGAAPTFHNNLGNVLQAQGQWTQAAAAYENALRLKPDYAAAHFNLGVTLQAQNRLDAAAAAYSRAIECRPDYAEAHVNLGNVRQAQGLLSEAVDAYRHALDHRPTYAEALVNLGNVLQSQGLPDQAMAAYQSAIRLRPDFAEAHRNLAILLLATDRLESAAAACRTALAYQPDYSGAYTVLGNVLREQGDVAGARTAYRTALQLSPDSGEAQLGLTAAAIPVYVASVEQASAAVGDYNRALDELADWDALHPRRLGHVVGGYQPFYLAYRADNLRAPLSRYGDLMCAAAAAEWQAGGASIPKRRVALDRLRLVIVSGHVRQHPVWDVILRGFIAHLDRRRTEVMLFHTGSIIDEETRWAAAHVERFVQGPRPTRAWLADISQAGPDVLFYPEVGMDPATCALAAVRAAAHQVAGWGHPVTTGLSSIDQFLSGDLLESQGADDHYRERLIRLPGTGVCTEPPARAVLPWDGPAPESQVVRFALCQQPIKFDPGDDRLYVQIARELGPSEFWLVAPVRHAWATALLRDRLALAFRAAGLDPDRHLRIAAWMPSGRFAGFLDAMDVYLDCPAFSGYTTAWQAVHRGLPIVTLEGDYLRQRLAAGLLRQIGVTDGIASNRDRYASIAVQWGRESKDPGRRAARRDAIRHCAIRADGNRAAVLAFERTLFDAASR